MSKLLEFAPGLPRGPVRGIIDPSSADRPPNIMATHSGETKDVREDEAISDEKPIGNVKEVNTNSVALAAAIAAQKPNLWSPNMIKLYMIMSVGYLVSTMNGFGMKNPHPVCLKVMVTHNVPPPPSRQFPHVGDQRHEALPA